VTLLAPLVASHVACVLATAAFAIWADREWRYLRARRRAAATLVRVRAGSWCSHGDRCGQCGETEPDNERTL
jgi:hypothetical protein